MSISPSPLLSSGLLSSVSHQCPSVSISGSISGAETLVEVSAIIRALDDLMPGGYNRPWSLEEVATIAELEPADILAAVHAQLPRGVTHMQRFDSLSALLRETGITPPGGWTATALSELAAIPLDAISDLTTRAIHNVRATLATEGIRTRGDLINAAV